MPEATLDQSQRKAEEALLSIHEARVAATRQALLVAEADVASATARMRGRAAEDAAASLDAARALFYRPGSTDNAHGRCLTLDVLREIFVAWFELGEPEISKRLPMAYIAASVCKSWRAAALGISMLWTRIFLDLHPDGFYGGEEYVALALERSGNSGIDAEIDVGNFVGPDARTTSCSVTTLHKLLARSRILRLYSSQPPDSLETSILPYLQAEMPLLEELVLDVPRPKNFTKSGTILLLSAPKLRCLAFNQLPLRLISPSSLPNIESFSTEQRLSAAEVESIATSWPSLRFLNFDASHAVFQSIRFPNAHFSKLSELTVHWSAQGFLSSLKKKQVPCLRKLTLYNLEITTVGLASIIAESPWTSLQALSLWESWPSELLVLLKYLPNLVEFAVNNVFDVPEEGTPDPFFTLWRQTSLTEPPRLSSLRLVNCWFNLVTVQALVDFLAARSRATLPPDHNSPAASSMNELFVFQRGPLEEHVVFPEWIIPRLRMLVSVVTVDTSKVEVIDASDVDE